MIMRHTLAQLTKKHRHESSTTPAASITTGTPIFIFSSFWYLHDAYLQGGYLHFLKQNN